MSKLQLIEAVKAENARAIKELIEAGADVNQQDEHGWTPLNWAAGKGNLEIVSQMVSHGADVFKTGRDQRTPYMIALAAGRAKVARYLRQVEMDADGKNHVRPVRQYCKAYQLKDLCSFPEWSEGGTNRKWDGNQSSNIDAGGEALSAEEFVFLHQDYTVTKSMWHGEDVIFNQVTPQWKEFCTDTLQFRIPDDFDLIIPADAP